MICSNCGKSIPYMGSVCPWCDVDKNKDKSETKITVMVLIGWVIASVIGVSAGLPAFPVIGISFVLAAICGAVAMNKCK